jgi:hypothetical protein
MKALSANREPLPPMLIPLDPGRGELRGGDRRVGMGHHDIDRLGYRRDHRADRLQILEAGRIEHVGPGLLECLQPPDRGVDVGTAVDQLLGPRGQNKRDRQLLCHLDRSMHALDREIEAVDRVRAVAGEILDRTARQTGLRGTPDHLGGFFRLVGAAILEVAVGREVGRGGDHPRVVDDLVGADCSAAPNIGNPETGRRQRLEAERGKQPRGSGIPGVRDDESAWPPVQFLEYGGLFGLRTHCRSPSLDPIGPQHQAACSICQCIIRCLRLDGSRSRPPRQPAALALIGLMSDAALRLGEHRKLG